MADQNPWRKAYMGSARIRCQSLIPTRGPEGTLDPAKLQPLLNVFSLRHCRRLDEKHRLRVLLADDEWTVLSDNIDPATLLGPLIPLLDLNDGVLLRYLHGRHRLAACKLFFPKEEDHWWGVDLYLKSSKSNNLTPP